MTKFETPAWLLQQSRKYRPTEIFVPVVIGIGPLWSYNPERGGWYARVDVAVPIAPLVDEPVWQCDHHHDTEEEAWACAEDFAKLLIEAQVGGR